MLKQNTLLTECKTCSTSATKENPCLSGSDQDSVVCTCNAGFYGNGVACRFSCLRFYFEFKLSEVKSKTECAMINSLISSQLMMLMMAAYPCSLSPILLQIILFRTFALD